MYGKNSKGKNIFVIFLRKNKRYGQLSIYFHSQSALLFYVGIKRNAQFSNCNRILIFPPQFPDIPRKISAYLRTGSSSGANTRIMSALCNILNVNNLYLKGALLSCEKHHFGLQNGPYWRLKSTISHPEIGLIALRNRQYQKAKWTFLDYDSGYTKIWYCSKCPLLCMI